MCVQMKLLFVQKSFPVLASRKSTVVCNRPQSDAHPNDGDWYSTNGPSAATLSATHSGPNRDVTPAPNLRRREAVLKKRSDLNRAFSPRNRPEAKPQLPAPEHTCRRCRPRDSVNGGPAASFSALPAMLSTTRAPSRKRRLPSADCV